MKRTFPDIDWLLAAAWMLIILLLLAMLSGCAKQQAGETKPGKRQGSELSAVSVEAAARGIQKVQAAIPLVKEEKPRVLLESSVNDFTEAIEFGTQAGNASHATETALAKANEKVEKERRAVAEKMKSLGMWIGIAGAIAFGIGAVALRKIPLVAELGGSLLLAGGVVYGMGWAFGAWWLMLAFVLGGLALAVAYFVWGPFPNRMPDDNPNGMETE